MHGGQYAQRWCGHARATEGVLVRAYGRVYHVRENVHGYARVCTHGYMYSDTHLDRRCRRHGAGVPLATPPITEASLPMTQICIRLSVCVGVHVLSVCMRV